MNSRQSGFNPGPSNSWIHRRIWILLSNLDYCRSYANAVSKNVRLANEENGEGSKATASGEGKREGNRERRQRENGKGDVYNLGPRWQLRGSRYAKKGLPHGIRISSRSHLNFNLDGVARGHFSARCFHPLGAPGPRVICACLPRTSSGKRWKGLRDRARRWGEIEKKKKRARESSVCPIKNRARLPDVEIPGYDESARTHLIRVALNVKSGAPRVFPPYRPVG